MEALAEQDHAWPRRWPIQQYHIGRWTKLLLLQELQEQPSLVALGRIRQGRTWRRPLECFELVAIPVGSPKDMIDQRHLQPACFQYSRFFVEVAVLQSYLCFSDDSVDLQKLGFKFRAESSDVRSSDRRTDSIDYLLRSSDTLQNSHYSICRQYGAEAQGRQCRENATRYSIRCRQITHLNKPTYEPILGIGYSIGVNDVDTLKASVINFGAMVGLSLLTSFLFFSIPIFKESTPEILARTRPDVRDVLIAITGGLALIIAISRPKPQFNTVAGVAIATALMPPLCTAGFGLATGQFNYFGGAMFLFTINCIYIALAAFVITKYLKFPMLKYINQAKRKRISRVASLIALVILAFSIYLFYQLYVLNDYTIKAEKFIEKFEGRRRKYYWG